MKNFLLLLAIFFTSLAYGQFQPSQQQYLDKDNLLVDPGFENGKFRGWTYGGAASCVLTTTAIAGDQSIACTTSGNSFQIYQDVTSKMSVLANSGGVIRVEATNTAPNVTFCVRYNSVLQTGNLNCRTLNTSGVRTPYEIPIQFNGTATGVEIYSASTTGLTTIDSFELSTDLRFNSVTGSGLAGESFFDGNDNCTPSRTNVAYGAFTDDSDCPGPTIIKQNLGNWQTTDANNLEQTITNLPARTYIAEFNVPASTTTSRGGLKIFDGSTACEPETVVRADSSGNSDGYIVKCSFTYTQEQASRTFELYGFSTAGSISIFTPVTGQASFRLYAEPEASQTYTQYNVGGEVTFTGSGSWVSNTTYTKATYKLLNDGWVEYQYHWSTTGAPTSANLTLNLPSGHTIDTSRLPRGASNQMVFGMGDLFDAAPARFSGFVYFDSSSLTSVTAYPEFSNGTNGNFNAPVTATSPFTWANGDSGQLTFRLPITAWRGSSITASFENKMDVPNVSKPKTIYYAFGGAGSLSSITACTSSPCTEYFDSEGTIAAPTRSGTGTYDITIPSGTFANTSFVHCTCSTTGGSFDCGGAGVIATNSSGGFATQARTATQAGVAQDRPASLMCSGSAP